MSIEVTYHGKRVFDQAAPVDVLRCQPVGAEGNLFTVADGSKSQPVKYSGLYRIYAVTDSRVRGGPPALADASAGARMGIGSVEVWWLEAGDVFICGGIA